MSEPLHESADQAGEHAWSAEHIASYVAAGLATTDRLRLRQHLDQCDECRQTVAELEALDVQMRQLFAVVQPSPDLETRTVQAVRREPRPVRARVRRAAWSWPMKAMMAAAAVMLLVGVGAFLSRETGPADLHSYGYFGSMRIRQVAPSGLRFLRPEALPSEESPTERLAISTYYQRDGTRRWQFAARDEKASPEWREESTTPNLGLIVPSDARKQTSLTGGIKGGKGESAGALNYNTMMHGSTSHGRKVSAMRLADN